MRSYRTDRPSKREYTERILELVNATLEHADDLPLPDPGEAAEEVMREILILCAR